MSEDLTTNGTDVRTVVLVAVGVVAGLVVLNVSRSALSKIRTHSKKND